MDFSVVIPTYNGTKRLPSVFKKLTYQTQAESINWEIWCKSEMRLFYEIPLKLNFKNE